MSGRPGSRSSKKTYSAGERKAELEAQAAARARAARQQVYNGSTSRAGAPRGTAPAAPATNIITGENFTLPIASGLLQNQAPVPSNRPTADPYAAAAAKAAADAAAAQAAAQAAAGKSALDRAKNLEPQIKALLHALSDEGFKKALDQNLADILKANEEGIGLLKESHTARGQTFLDTAADTEKATAQGEGSAFENLVRERQDTMTGLLTHGAGETDALRSMVMAARQFRDNQAEGNRAYFDTMRSVKSGLTDLNVDTRTAMSNAYRGMEAEKDRLWQNFYDRRSDTYTQLGNLYGQQGDYYIQAAENKVTGGDQAGAAKSAEQAYMNAANESAKSYTQEGTPQWLKDWKGIEAPQARQANTDLAAAVQFEPLGKAEGASLRSWG